ncbi:alkaline phosphatase [Pacificimonas flava]|uniref:Alkaline phosphatase n=2 Tax=Pacificimonas TaxID=1960290 RepID=A0A219B7Y4_9SPHN|nr:MULTISPECIES: DedA family protein [Pacificimonas]MBZ6378404.1 DedA family protein [Pacificimonas aurantium]OWV34294.1 alkaline phosphatase [Pacificimonas flava]
MTAWIEQLIADMGYIGIALLMFLENVFPPIPSELIMPLAGFTSARGELNIYGVIAAGTIGTFFGALIWYYVGHLLDEDKLRRWTGRHGRWLGMSRRELEKVDYWFDTKGRWAVLFGRVVPTIRTLISVPAGAFRMPLRTFVPYTFFGSLAWNTLLTFVGRGLGENYEAVESYIGPVSMAIIAAMVLGYLYRVATFEPDQR